MGNIGLIKNPWKNNFLDYVNESSKMDFMSPFIGKSAVEYFINCDIRNNISSGTVFGTSNGNQSNVDMSTVFVGPEGNSTDGQWQLKPGSPAIGAGTDGNDIGMFGGPSPYVLSGIPGIPHIYFFSSPANGSGSSGLQVHIKAKSSGG